MNCLSRGIIVINQDDLKSVQNENFFKTCKRVIEKFVHIELIVILALKS